MAGKKGFLGDLGSKIMHELTEEDPKSPTTVAPAPAPAPTSSAPAPAPTAPSSGTMAYTFGMGSSPGMPAAPEPLDPKAVEAVTSGVFVPINGRPSRYMSYTKMWDTLLRPADPSVPLNALRVSDPTITAPAILDDIDAHLALLDQVTASAESDFQAAAQQRLGGADAQLAELTKANEDAAAEVARHQKETAERITQISQLQVQRGTDEAKIGQAKARTEAAEASVRQQLTAAKALIASIPPSA